MTFANIFSHLTTPQTRHRTSTSTPQIPLVFAGEIPSPTPVSGYLDEFSVPVAYSCSLLGNSPL
jgi:hypothetical protein